MSAPPDRSGNDGPEPDVRSMLEMARRLAALHDAGRFQQDSGAELSTASTTGNPLPLGRTRKVSVSLPEELTAVVRQRVGKGEFSHYVTEAVTRQLELDLLAELADLLDAEHGPIPEEYLAEAGAAWPDAE
jgi:Arc/MetJ-type ribon-helix-helix transcriptional regulator